MKRAFSLLELVIVIAICTAILVPVIDLSRQNMSDPDELMERCVANGLCLDAMERLKRYKPYWPLPGADATPPYNMKGPSLTEMFMPVELILKRATVFDSVYLDQIRQLGMQLTPTIKRDAVTTLPGLFRLETKTTWTDKNGKSHEVKFVRYCYAP